MRQLEQTLGPDNPETLRAQSNLALDLASVSDYPAARELLHRTFTAQSQASQGVSRIDVLSTWSDLSRVLRLAGEYAEARLLAEDAYEFGRKELGPDHPWTLRTGKEQSIAQRVAGEPIDEVASFAREILAQFERVLGDNHPETLAAATNLANTLRVAGQLDEAFEIARDLMARYREAYQPGHPYLYGCDGNVAIVTRLRGNPAAAREIDQAAVDALTGRLGRDHDYPLTVGLGLASDLAALGDASAAVGLGEDTPAPAARRARRGPPGDARRSGQPGPRPGRRRRPGQGRPGRGRCQGTPAASARRGPPRREGGRVRAAPGVRLRPGALLRALGGQRQRADAAPP